MMSALGGARGSPKSRRKEPNLLVSGGDKGGGVKQAEKVHIDLRRSIVSIIQIGFLLRAVISP